MADAVHVNRHHWRDRLCEDPALTDSCFRVAYKIAGYVNDAKGFAWPSLAKLAADLGISRKTVSRAIARLERAGYLDVTRKGRHGHTNEYRLRLPDSHNSPAGQDSSVPSRGQSCPKRGDRDVPQSPLMNLSRTLQRPSPPNKVPVAPVSGLSKVTGGLRKRDRGTYELQIANRLGANGLDMLSSCPEAVVNELCVLQKQHRLSDQRLFEAIAPQTFSDETGRDPR